MPVGQVGVGMYNFCPSQEEQILNTGQSGREQPTNRRRVLQDYRQQGKRFIPPMLQHFPIKETSWIDDRLPELVWIALLLQIYGQPEGTKIAVGIAEAAAKCSGADRLVFAFASDFGHPSSEQKKSTAEELRRCDLLEQAGLGLVALSENYSTFPMAFLSDTLSPSRSYRGTTLRDLRALLEEMYDRHTLLSILVQAAAVEIAFKNNRLQVPPNSRLANMSTLGEYPHTAESQETAYAVVATVSGLLSQVDGDRWPTEFWNRGRALEPCEE